jgi:hypothetical protein
VIAYCGVRAMERRESDPTRLDEPAWLRHRIDRLRTVSKMTNDARALAVLQELIDEAHRRLRQLERPEQWGTQ